MKNPGFAANRETMVRLVTKPGFDGKSPAGSVIVFFGPMFLMQGENDKPQKTKPQPENKP